MGVIALAGGSWIFLVVIVVGVAGMIYGFFTVQGSGIEQHPHDGGDGAPGAKGRSEVSGRDEGEGSNLDDHGTE